MNSVKIHIETTEFKATEIISDLRIVAETLYGPMKMVGFWDRQEGMHLCPFLERHQECPHKDEKTGDRFISYEKTLQRERQATLAVIFPHASITLYMS
jgi:hypothetical protein